MKQNNMLAMILAGGRGSRLHDLTQKVAKPAVSYGGKFSTQQLCQQRNRRCRRIDSVRIHSSQQLCSCRKTLGIGRERQRRLCTPAP